MNKIIIFIGPAIGVMVWFCLTAFNLINPLYLPSISETFVAFINFFRPVGLVALLSTVYRIIISFVFAGILGILLGIVLGINKKIYLSLEFLIDFFRSLPAPALLPLCLLFFGIGDLSKIAVGSFMAFLVVLTNTIQGVWNVSKLRIKMGRIFRANNVQILRDIIIPDSLPQIFIGLRISLSFTIIIIIITEMFIGTGRGLGQEIYNSYQSYRIPQLYALIILVGLLGYSLNKISMFYEKKIIHWKGL